LWCEPRVASTWCQRRSWPVSFALATTLPLAKLNAPSAFDFGLLAAMGSLQLGLSLYLFMRGAPHLTAAQVDLLTLLEVILAPIWVWLAFSEVPAPLSSLARGTRGAPTEAARPGCHGCGPQEGQP
jgi:drug/metabolite transporter (DMT)-like permease